jgi:limonene-1,2-epoxide hydrolase
MGRVLRALWVLPLLLLVCSLAGCGGGSSADPARDGAQGGDASVVRHWADALRKGDVAGAAQLFALPSKVANGTPVVTLRTRSQVRGFNRALPCGAKVLRTTAHHGYVIAQFRLTDRRGPGAVGDCPGRGATAATAFRIVSGRIAEWRRVALPGDKPKKPAPGDPT